MEKTKDIFKNIEQELSKVPNLDEKTKSKIYANIAKLKNLKMNLMIVGGTGCGKSSTINALFEKEVAKVGDTPNPETMTIAKYELDNLILWDSPGLGDGKKADKKHSKAIIDKLMEKGNDGKALIDLVLAVVDASGRDMGTDYQLINEVILPVLEDKNRILVALNKCDLAMSRKRGKPAPWNEKEEKPTPELLDFLDEKVKSVKERVHEATKVHVEPIYYSAEWYYNMSKLLCFIIEHAPDEKRAVVYNKVNREPKVWENDDFEHIRKQIRNEERQKYQQMQNYQQRQKYQQMQNYQQRQKYQQMQNYQQRTVKAVKESATTRILAGAGAGAAAGSFFGPVGTAIGAAIGGAAAWFFG